MSFIIFVISTFMIPLLLALVVGLIILLIKKPKVGFIVIFLPTLIVVAGILLLFPVKYTRRVTSHYGMPVENVSISSGLATSIVTGPLTNWQFGLEREFIADKYPSFETAGYGLGLRLQSFLIETGHADIENVFIEHNGLGLKVFQSIREGLLNNNPRHYKVVLVEHADEDVAIAGEAVIIEVKQEGKDLIAEVDRSAGINVTVDESEWLEDLKSYRDSHGNQYIEIVTSEMPVNGEAESYLQAINNLSNKINQRLKNRVSPEVIANEGLIRSHDMILDEFTQRLEGTVAPFYRTALLVDMSPGKIDSVGFVFKGNHDKVVINRASKALSVMLMMGVIFAIYLILNVITKGYYKNPIVVICIILFCLFCAFSIMLG